MSHSYLTHQASTFKSTHGNGFFLSGITKEVKMVALLLKGCSELKNQPVVELMEHSILRLDEAFLSFVPKTFGRRNCERQATKLTNNHLKLRNFPEEKRKGDVTFFRLLVFWSISALSFCFQHQMNSLHTKAISEQ